MSRLIDADKLKEMMVETLEALMGNPKMDGQEIHLINAFQTVGVMIDDLPTVAYVEKVVLCKDCKYWHNDGIITTCDKHIGNGIPREHFCSWGEKVTENG